MMMERIRPAVTVSSSAFPLLAPNGTAAAPSYSFSNETGAGIRLLSATGTGQIGIGFGTDALTINFDSTSAVPAMVLPSTWGIGWSTDPVQTAKDLVIMRDAADTLALRRGANAQTFRVYNTFTSASVYETLEMFWSSNIGYFRMSHTGGTLRATAWPLANSVNEAIRVGTGTSGGLIFGNYPTQSSALASRVNIAGGGSVTATSGTHSELAFTANFSPSSSSTMIARDIAIDHTINYSGGGAGQIKLIHINPTVTAAPTGLNAGVVFSASASALGGLHFHNQSDEATNYEIGFAKWVSDVFRIGTDKGGSGTSRVMAIGNFGGGSSGDVHIYSGGANTWKFQGSGQFAAQGNYRISHGTSALATTATEGFFFLQSCAGTPTGTPASIPSGQVPLIIDSTNSKFYAYLGGAWKALDVGGTDATFA